MAVIWKYSNKISADNQESERKEIVMMSVRELKELKKKYGYTNEMIAEKTGVPLSTVQKIFSGATKHPRYDTLLELTKGMSEYNYDTATYVVREEALEYSVGYEKQFKADSDSRWPRQGRYTVDDIRALPDEIRVELIDGVIYDMTAPKPIHQDLLFELAKAFSGCVEKCESDCKVRLAPFDVRLLPDDKNMFQPDIFITCDESKNNGDFYDGAPELAVEILSPSTRSKDFIVKSASYKKAGVREYWIVDPKDRKVWVFFFEEDALPEVYTFTDKIPVRISEGRCDIDFAEIQKRIFM